MKHRITTSKDAYDFIKPYYAEKDTEVEHCAIILLNSASVVKSIHFVSLGSENSCIIPHKVICKKAILDLADRVILFHNHPSRNSTPSKADIKATQKLLDALHTLDIHLADHIVIGDGEYFSFNDEKKTTE